VTAPYLRALALAIVLAAGATPALPARQRVTRGEAASAAEMRARADSIVERLRELPLPMQASAHGLPSRKAAPPPLPALETRRQQVYSELHALGQASVPALVRALRDPDPEMRRNVAVAIDVVGGGWWQFPDGDSKVDLRPALPSLLAALRDSDPGVRAWAAQDISDIGAAAGAAVPGLRALLRSPDAQSRGSACNALGGIGVAARDALPDLRRALHDPSPEVRQAARDAIASVERAGAVP
jgi:hypothetical protein